MTDQRAIDLSVDVDGTPEEVWEAIATGPGVSSWFIPTRIEGRAGGEVAMDFGGYGTETGSVTAWEPHRRFVYATGGERPLAYEWLVEARDGGRCTVRLVNSGFGAGEEWDGDFDGMSGGWRIFLESLRLHLAHFRGRQARATVPTVVLAGPNQRAWASLCTALGIAEDLTPGQRLVTSGDAPPLSGTVVRADRSATTSVVHVLLDGEQGKGFIAAEGGGDQVACSLYLYRYDEPSGPADPWTPWLTDRFPPMDAPLPGSSA